MKNRQEQKWKNRMKHNDFNVHAVGRASLRGSICEYV